jgi:hypothetical protein
MERKSMKDTTKCQPPANHDAILAISMSSGLSSCQSQKKLAKKKQHRNCRKNSTGKKDLLAIINDDGRMTLEEKEFKLNSIKRMNLQDQEVKDLIVQAEEK